MQRMLSRHIQCNRPILGFTLVELLVVIAIIGMLVALLIPAVGAARARMRKASCLNNMREIGTAIINYETSKQRFPGYLEAVKARGRDSGLGGYVALPAQSDPYFGGQTFGNTGDLSDSSRSASRISWAAHILPQIDRNDVWDLIQGAEDNSDAQLLAQQTIPKIELYVCPDDTDITSVSGAPGLTYMVNTGAWDWDGSNFVGDNKANGVFFNLIEGNIKSRLSGISDGAATTLMLSENIQKNPTYSWLGVESGNPGEQQFGMVWVVPSADYTNRQLNFPNPGCVEPPSTAIDDQAAFTAEPSGALEFSEVIPCFARPRSNHSDGGFNVIYVDHHGGSLNPDIDYVVYQQLLTAQGSKCVDPQDPLANPQPDAVRIYRTAPPISASDVE